MDLKYIENLDQFKDSLNEISNIHKTDYESNDFYLLAAKYGHLDIMKYLENEHEWDVNTKNIFKDDAYLLATEGGHIHIMKYLQNKHNWNIYVTNNSKENAYLIAALYGHLHVMRFFEELHNNNTNISLCDDEKLIINKLNWNVHVTDDDEDDAYLFAASGGHIHILKYLEDVYGWDVHVKNKNMTDAYLIAAYNGRIECLKYLENKHGNVSVRDIDGDDALLLAAHNGHIHIIKYLEHTHCWNLYVTNANEENAYIIAKNSGFYELSNYLQEKMLPTKLNNDFRLLINKTHNVKCYICQDKFEKNESYCKCHKNHIIHRKCYLQYLTINNIDKNYKCVYCRDKMYLCSLKYK